MKKLINFKNVIILSLVLSMIVPIQIPHISSVVSAKTTTAKTTTKITISESKVTLEIGTFNYQLKLFNGEKAIGNSSIKWSTSDKSIATISKYGRITAVKEGTVTITAVYEGKNYKSKVTIIPKQVGKVRGEITRYSDTLSSIVSATDSIIYLIPKDTSLPTYTLKQLTKINTGSGKNNTDKLRRIYSSPQAEDNIDGGSTYTFSNVPNGEYILLVMGGYTQDTENNKLNNEKQLLKYLGDENTKILQDNIRNEKKYVIFDITITTGCELVYNYYFE